MFGKLTLIECRHCSKEVSIESKLCVHCGCPEPDNEKFLENQHNSQLSVKLYNFFDSGLISGFVDFCGFVALVCSILFMYDLGSGRPEWGLGGEYLLLLTGTICGSIYATFYIYIKKFWLKQEDKEDWSVYLFLGIIFFIFIFGLSLFFLIQIQ